jgi:hypothetical protein
MVLGWPLARNVIRGGIRNNSFGMVRNGGTRPHQGWDLEAPVGTPCFAVEAGRIEFVSDGGALGKTIALAFNFEGRTLYAIYAHLSAIDVAEGQAVTQGQRLGLTGKSGNAIEMQGKQIHLHFEIRTSPKPGLGLTGRIDPQDIFRAFPLMQEILANPSATPARAAPATASAGAAVPAAISGRGWELHIRRHTIQSRGGETRTVGDYQVYHDGQPQSTRRVGAHDVPLFGQTAEPRGPGQNERSATTNNPSRIRAGAYPLATQLGGLYVTFDYKTDPAVVTFPLPGIELLNTGVRTEILIHPGKNNFLSSIGCINLCTLLDTPQELISFAGSRRRVIALIDDMKASLGGHFPASGAHQIPDAGVVIEGEP